MTSHRHFEGRRVMVTGSLGFIGSHLVDKLAARGARVTALARPSAVPEPFERDDGVRVVGVEMRTPPLTELLQEVLPEYVFHLAGHASIVSSFEDPERDLDDNVGTTLALLEAMRSMRRPPTLVNASSSAVYGSGSPHPLREDAPLEVRTPYGASKLCAEAYVRIYARTHGMRAATARLFPLFGPGQRRHVIYDLLVKLTRDPGHLEVVGDGLQTRNLLYISDCVDGLLLLARKAALVGEPYNVAGHIVVTIRQLVDALCEELELDPEITYTGRFRAGGSDDWIADLSRIRELGFEPGVDLEEGLRDTVAWFRREVAPTLRDS